ncbi:unnamed protein product [Miscanthus lutarioriparius]|uniref:Isopenicillin N synthase-like Fe(2+) 2OG dioxygenase domain-containing protein n=1 Tax=Miscanthus lutarioriparius TaxID=422564 RepID=A0A811SM68_9POAL|nr:unnamed protein product [Miscanthus lutarioriparius]
MEEKMALGKNSRYRATPGPTPRRSTTLRVTRTLPSWKKTMQSYHANALTTGKRILSLIALSLDLDAEFFHKNGAFEPPSAFIRLLHYAGDVNGPDNKDIVGAAAHSDYGMLTLLATDGTPGLQA